MNGVKPPAGTPTAFVKFTMTMLLKPFDGTPQIDPLVSYINQVGLSAVKFILGLFFLMCFHILHFVDKSINPINIRIRG